MCRFLSWICREKEILRKKLNKKSQTELNTKFDFLKNTPSVPKCKHLFTLGDHV
jgi:hypothetical protein